MRSALVGVGLPRVRIRDSNWACKASSLLQGSEVVTARPEPVNERSAAPVFTSVTTCVTACRLVPTKGSACEAERKHPRCMAMRAGIGRYVLVWVCVGRSVPFCLSCPKG